MKQDCPAAKSYIYTLTVKSLNNTSAAHIDVSDSSNWTTQGTIRANFLSKAGREFFNAEQVQADQSFLIETPSNNFSRTIEPGWRLEDADGTVYQIESVVDKNRMRQVVEITVKEAK